MDNNQEKPVLIIKRAKIFGSILSIIELLLALSFTTLLTLKENMAIVFGLIGLIYLLFACIYPLLITQISLYNKNIKIEYLFMTINIEYSSIKSIDFFYSGFGRIFIIHLIKKIKYLSLLFFVIIKYSIFNKTDIKEMGAFFVRKGLLDSCNNKFDF
jgi:hypothetical protein